MTGPADTTVCESVRVELSRFFKETTGVGALSFYKKESDGSYTFLSDQKPFRVAPSETTVYGAKAIAAASGCESVATVDFRIIVHQMPQIVSAHVANQPDCGTGTGQIKLSVADGSGNYAYSINNGATYADLPADGMIKNLPVGDYQIYVKDKAVTGCAASIGETVSLSPANSGLHVTEATTAATSCSANDGSIRLTVNGGIAPYRYRVGNGADANLPSDGIIGSGFGAGTYHITLTDSTGCTATAGSVQVKVGGGFGLLLSQTTPADCKADGALYISLSGGMPDYAYRLSGKGWITMDGTAETVVVKAGLH